MLVANRVSPVLRPRIPLNGHGDSACPQCEHGVLIRDLSDLCCLCCGWRESGYFPMFGYNPVDHGLLARLIYNDVSVLPP